MEDIVEEIKIDQPAEPSPPLELSLKKRKSEPTQAKKTPAAEQKAAAEEQPTPAETEGDGGTAFAKAVNEHFASVFNLDVTKV